MAEAERRIVIEQPNYIPWIGYFDLIDRSDVFVWYDDVQYTKRDWRNRNRFAAVPEPAWVTIPVKTKGRYHQTIAEVEVDHGARWVEQHLTAFQHAYAKAPHYAAVRELYAGVLEKRAPLLADLTIELGEAIARHLGLRATFARSSRLEGITGAKQARLLEVCDRFDCKTYLSGPAAKDYIDPDGFRARGYALEYIVYEYDPYPRVKGPPDAPLSILDPLVHLGPEGTLELMRRRRRAERTL